MSNRIYSGTNKFEQNYRTNNSTIEQDRYKLPAINNGTTTAAMPNMNSSSMTRSGIPPTNDNYSTPLTNLNTTDYNPSNTNNLAAPTSSTPYRSGEYNTRTTSNHNYKLNDPPRGVVSSQTFSSTPKTSGVNNTTQQVPANRSWSSNKLNGFDKTNTTNTDMNKNSLINQNNSSSHRRPLTSGPDGFNYSSLNMNTSNGQKNIVRDRHLANEILQKAGITSNLTPNDCLEVITDTPVTKIDNVNCDPNPLCLKKPAESQECYEQSIVVRHLQQARPAVPAPIIIREHCSYPPPQIQPPILIRKIPLRPSTPPPLIIRECPPPSMSDLQEPKIIDREVPPAPPPPRQVIVEQFPTPPAKPRSIIFEKWLPFVEPEDRPCIVEKAAGHDIPIPKNVIIQYESIQPKIQPQCIDEGISFVDPKKFVTDKPNGNVEVCYVDQINNLPDHIKSQLSPEVLAAIGIQHSNQQKMTNNPHVNPTNPPILYQQNTANNPNNVPINPSTLYQQNTTNNPNKISTNPSTFYQQNERTAGTFIPPKTLQRTMMPNGCHPGKLPSPHLGNSNMYRQQQQQQQGIRALSASTRTFPHCHNKYNTNILGRSGMQGFNNLTRQHYNPWATTYQVSYTNKARGMCRAR